MKKTIIALVVIIIAGAGIYFIVKNSSPTPTTPASETPAVPAVTDQTPAQNVTTPPADTAEQNPKQAVLGTSVEGKDIVAYNYGTGPTEILLVGGIHGGYEWNTTLLAYQMMDYLEANPSVIPSNVKVTVVPVLNPDGLNKVVGTIGRFTQADVSTSQTTLTAGRFNANTVDLNRNFDCDWHSTGTWQAKTVSGGSKAFSEPESLAIKNYIEIHKPAAVVAWYSSAGGVYASHCDGAVSAETNAITKKFAAAAGYPAYNDFSSYAVTGDMTNWLAKQNIPALSVLLTNHTDTELAKNQAGILALFKYYTK